MYFYNDVCLFRDIKTPRLRAITATKVGLYSLYRKISRERGDTIIHKCSIDNAGEENRRGADAFLNENPMRKSQGCGGPTTSTFTYERSGRGALYF